MYLRDLLENDRFRSSKSQLPVALGKDIFGNPVDADLAKMPHLLVAGATGTGKSVFLNALLCSILCRKAPDELKLLLVDPKLLELSVYAGIPHLIADVVTNPKRASAALAGVVRKMEERYHLMAALGVRSIQQFNERCQREVAAGNNTFRLKPKPGEAEGVEVPFERLPYIVVIIDELADLMVVCAKDVEESLQRLAQMARAAGIHLVLATQRPSVDVLTGVIKANFPARISFQVSSRTDSRTILDQNGADSLLGDAAADTLSGAGGNDTVDGDADVDLVDFSSEASEVGVDLDAGSATGASIGTDVLIDLEQVDGTGDSDTLEGSNDDDTLRGLGDEDTIAATADSALAAGEDSLEGNSGADTIDTGLEADAKEDLGEKMLQVLPAAGYRIRSLGHIQPSLEDVFLAATRRSWDARLPDKADRRAWAGHPELVIDYVSTFRLASGDVRRKG